MTGEGGGGNEQQSPRDVASYIAALTSELAQMARRHRMDGLAYTLLMAHMEAEKIAEGSADSGGRPA